MTMLQAANDLTTLPHLLKVLIIEDNKGDAILLTKSIQQVMSNTVSIVCSKTLQDALQQLSLHEFDVALLDRNLPDATEFSGLFSIQNIAPKLPVIVLTAYQDEHTALAAILNGAQDYLFKGKTDIDTIKRAIHYAILRKKFEHVLIMRANYDVLTGLVNRSFFENRLDLALIKAKRHYRTISIFFLDLDCFKTINDSFGHSVGDKLLKEVSMRIKNPLRLDDTVARFGGDEFAILLEDIPDKKYVAEIAQKIIDAMIPAFYLNNQQVQITISIGITLFNATTNSDKETLLHQADLMMYQAKKKPDNAFFIYPATHDL